VQHASIAYSFTGIGSCIATVTIGRLIDRFDGYRVVAIMFVFAFMSLGIFGMMARSPFLVIAASSFICGLFIFGSNSGCMAICTISYPVSIRGSGIGWAYAVGKLGSMLAPVMVGVTLGLNWSVARICVVNGLAALICAVVAMALRQHMARRRADSAVLAAAADAALS
jgi:AAHS family 4-hydroxybenzoate transporter-like MFS transporter